MVVDIIVDRYYRSNCYGNILYSKTKVYNKNIFDGAWDFSGFVCSNILARDYRCY